MKRTLVVLCLLASTLVAGRPVQAAQPQLASPPGQLYVVSVNTYQNQIIGTERFRMMLDLARALLDRPAAFDGGSFDVGAAPDIILLQEMRESNLEIFEKLIRQRSDFNYEIAGSTTTNGDFIINADKVAMQGEPHVWTDPCFEGQTPGEEETTKVRTYQWAQFTELDTGALFTVASVHFSKSYQRDTGQSDCLERNVAELRNQLAGTTGPTFIGGDFNKRAVESPRECDVEEQATPLAWWLEMTAPAQGTAYTDSVKTFHQERGLSLEDEWTHEQKAQTVTCDTTSRFRRTRIDYMFTSGVTTASAHTDHPGWSGGDEPGTRHPINPKYSDHRFVAGRFGLVGPAQPAAPFATLGAGGVVNLSWTAPEVPVTEWLLYRAVGNDPYSLLGRFPPEILAFQDFSTEHGRTYRYALAAVDATGAQGLESPDTVVVPDARGPVISSRSPGRNGTDIERRADIVARYNEPVDPNSVSRFTINLYKNGRRVCGSTIQQSARVLVFDPCFPLGKRKEYKVVVYGVADELGNRGDRDVWNFTTR
jgi:endonuclease/exonuclease/phosphatase family metal-dependent hydrolase